MKILQIAALYAPHVGGIENYVHQLSRDLVKKGHEVTVYTSNIPKNKKYEVIDGVEIHRFGCVWSPLNNQLTPGILQHLLKENDFDIIHAHGYLQLTTNFAAFSTFKNKIPLVITLHGTVGDAQYDDWKIIITKIYNKTLCKWTLSAADTVIALTPSQKENLHKFGAKKIEVIPNGISLADINVNRNTNQFREKYGLNNKIIILYVGGLIARKGISYLIDAMQNVSHNSALIIVGGELKGHQGYKQQLLDKLSEKNISNVVFMGRVNESTLREAYMEADMLVLPSLSEGLPTVLLEAMSYKKPIIASNIPGNSDLITNNYNGILVEQMNSKEIADAINRLISHPEEREILGINAFNTINQNYTWETIVDRIEDTYIDCLRCKL
ncbi:MAG: glycosyltransferase family 4 protein [Methanomethylovorans sp.]|uniref:glycosyltransferase family 4 protein n=1 Tax=Methanomethylovorans sp. TaxID=2758717 RepID=UPI0035315B59